MLDVLHVTPSLDPRHGGPSRTVPALAAAQAALGARVALASVGALPAGFVETYPALAGGVHVFPPTPGPLGAALCASPGLARFLRDTPARAIHAHGLWLRPLHHARAAAARQRVPLVLAPRGMLEPWARAHHAWKKRLASTLVHPGALAAVAGWHATSEQEAANLRLLSPAPACVAPNGVEPPPAALATAARDAWLAAYPQLRDRRVALFYGRFHRKKRVTELIRLWGAAPRPGWTLLVAGLAGDYSVAELAELTGNAAPAAPATPAASHIDASVVVADGSAMPPPYALAELFLLPSHSENFGQAVAEALAAGLPALVTDTLPWRELDAAGAGRCVAWGDYPAALAALLAAPPAALHALGTAAHTWVTRHFTWEASARRLLDFYPTLAVARP